MKKKIIIAVIIFIILAVTGTFIVLAAQRPSARYAGYLLTDPINKEKVWYVSPINQKLYDLGVNPGETVTALKEIILGITDENLRKIPKSNETLLGDQDLRERLSGRFLLAVENAGNIWYVHPENLKRYYLINTDASFAYLRSLAVKISADDLKIIASGYTTTRSVTLLPAPQTQPQSLPSVLQPLAAATPVLRGCAYQNPACSANYDCIDNQCQLKNGCDYRNPSCDANYDCVKNQCQLKSGCAYQNPACGANQKCARNQCVSDIPVFSLKSAFLSSDPIALQIISSNQSVDLSNLNLSDKNSFIYKIYNALIMVGYSPQYNNVVGWGNKNFLTLYQFQKKNNLTEENNLTPDALKLLDAELQKYEKIYAYYASTFPLYNKMIAGRANEVSKDFVATLYQLPMSLLPAKIQLKTADEYANCILGLCVGSILNSDGTTPDFTGKTPYLPTGYLFDPLWFSAYPSFTQDNAGLSMMVILHEYAHHLDKIANPGNLIDTAGFYRIGFVMSQLPGKNLCGARRSNSMGDFLTAYGYEGSATAGYCPRGSIKVTEDFADSFAFYVGAGKRFRAAAVKSTYIQDKYNWLKTNVFDGAEYDTDLIYNLPSGCNDKPGYASCSEDYLWNGALQKL